MNGICIFNFIDCVFFLLILSECQILLVCLVFVLVEECTHLVCVFIFIQLLGIFEKRRWFFVDYIWCWLMVNNCVFLLLLEIITLNQKIFILSLLIQIQILLTLVFDHLPAIVTDLLVLGTALLASDLWMLLLQLLAFRLLLLFLDIYMDVFFQLIKLIFIFLLL